MESLSLESQRNAPHDFCGEEVLMSVIDPLRDV
jgi:hypothetical protein